MVESRDWARGASPGLEAPAQRRERGRDILTASSQ
jgi:hypothetical protein